MNNLSALETNQNQISRRSFFRGAIAAVPFAAIPAGAAVEVTAKPLRGAGDIVLQTMHDRAMAAWQAWRDLDFERRESDNEEIEKALREISTVCGVMLEIPAGTAETARMKIAVGDLQLDFERGWGQWGSTTWPGGTQQLREQGRIELAALS
jgi:hypothetical protein